MSKRSLFLALWCLCVFSARAQIDQNNPVAQTAETPAGTSEAWWDHVKSLREKGVTGTSGQLLRYDTPEGQKELEGTKFFGKQDGQDVEIKGGTHAFYDMDFKNLRITITGGADVSFYNCKFGQKAGLKFQGNNGKQGDDCILCLKGDNMPEGKTTKVTLRFCDFEGPGVGGGRNAVIKANTSPNSGKAAIVDAAYCRTWGQSGDSWKMARGTTRFSYFDPAACTPKKPIFWESGEYSENTYVSTPALHTAHVWRAKRPTNQKPRFEQKESSSDWQYLNPHADIFHIYGGDFNVLAEGHYINQDTDDLAEEVEGVIFVGLNNTIRRADPLKNWRGTHGGDVVRGCYIPRNEDERSSSIHNNLGGEEDSEWLRLEYLRLGGPLNKVIYPPKKNQESTRATRVALDGLQDLQGNPLRIQDVDPKTFDASEAYFTRDNARSDAPTLTKASEWSITVDTSTFAPHYVARDGGYVAGMAVSVDGQKVVRFVEEGGAIAIAYQRDGYQVEKVSNGEYTLRREGGTAFYPVVWRGGNKSSLKPAESSASVNDTQVLNAVADQDFDVLVISDLGQSQLTHARSANRKFQKPERPTIELEVENITTIVGRSLTTTFNRNNPGASSVEIETPTKQDARNKLNNGVIAAANLFHRMFPGKHLILAPQCKSGTGLESLTNANDDDGGPPKRTWSEATEVRDSLEAELAENWAGKKVIKIAHWCWWGAENQQLTNFVDEHVVRMTGCDRNGNKVERDSGIAHSLWDLSGENRDPLFDDTWKLVMSLPGGNSGSTPKPAKNYGYLVKGQGPNNKKQESGRTLQFGLEFSQQEGRTTMMASVQEFLDLPFVSNIATPRVMGGPIIALMNDFDLNEGKGENDRHPSQYSNFGQPLLGAHLLSQAVLGAFGADARILGHKTTADGKKTTLRIGLPQGEELTTMGKVKDVTDDVRYLLDEDRDHFFEDGTGFVLRRQNEPWSDARALVKTGDADYRAQVRITNTGSGTGAERYGEVEITWHNAVSDGDRLSYHPWGEFDAELGKDDAKLIPNRHYLIARKSAWDNGSETGFPGHAVSVQTGGDLAVGEMILKLGEDYIGEEDNGSTGALRVSGGSIVEGGGGNPGGGGSSPEAPKISSRNPALDGSAYKNVNISVTWDGKIKLGSQGVIKIKRVDTDPEQELARYELASGASEVRLSGDRTKLTIDPSVDLPQGAEVEVLASLSAITSEEGTRITEANKLLTRFMVNRGGASARTVGGATDMVLYPNPSEGSFTLMLPETDEAGQVSVLDLSGKVVYQAPTDGKRQLPIATTLPTGSYLVKVVGAKASYVERLVVE